MNKLALPDLRSWNAGDGVTAERMNLLQDMMEFAIAPPECKVIRKATFSMGTASTAYAITFDNRIMDNVAAFGTGAWPSDTPTRLYARVPGMYEFHYSVRWNSALEGGRRFMFLNPDGLSIGSAANWFGTTETIAAGGGDGNENQSGTIPWYMNTGQFVELGVFFDGAGVASASLISATVESPDYRFAASIHMKWVSF